MHASHSTRSTATPICTTVVQIKRARLENASRTTHPETLFEPQNTAEYHNTTTRTTPHASARMSLHQLLQECGGYDDGAGSDKDVCIGNDSPPAPPAGSASAVSDFEFPAIEHQTTQLSMLAVAWSKQRRHQSTCRLRPAQAGR